LPKYVNSNNNLFDADDEEIKQIFLTALTKMYPKISENDIKFMGIARAKQVLALPTLNYSKHLPPVNTSVPGLYILNSAQITDGTLNVNETIKIAESKLNEILSSL